jgi:aminotransferase
MATQHAPRPIEGFLADRVLGHGRRRDEQTVILMNMAEGRTDLVSLGDGDPDLPTPPVIVRAAQRALEEGATHYTHWQGRTDLRAAIREKYRREFGLIVEPSQVVVTQGAQEAVYISFQTTLNPGDEVLLGDPHYGPYTSAIKLCGGVPIYVPTREEDRFVIQPREILERITPRTKTLLLVSPNNPTGAVIPRDVMAEIAVLANEHDLLVIMDELYEKMMFDGAEHVTAAVFPGMADRTITINGFSKSYAMTGWRLGYLLGPQPLVSKMEIMKHTMTICAPAVSQAGGLAALTVGDDALAEMVAIYRERRRVLIDGFRAMGLRCDWSVGGLFLYVNIGALGVRSFDFCLQVFKAGVQVFPATAFGGGDGYIRVSFLRPADQLRLAVERMAPVVERFKHGG